MESNLLREFREKANEHEGARNMQYKINRTLQTTSDLEMPYSLFLNESAFLLDITTNPIKLRKYGL